MSTFTEFWTGTDTNAALPFPTGTGVAPEHFYIGRIGGEVTASSYGFDIKAAKAANRVFGYWDLAGPSQVVTLGATWGEQQAKSFASSFHNFRPAQVRGTTLFLDVESGNGGWGNDSSANRSVLRAALAALKSLGFTPGVYIGLSAWVQFFSSAEWSPNIPFVLWLAGNANQTLAEAIAQWETLPTLGGMRPMLWQYNSSGSTASPTQDRNLTPYGGWLHGAWKPTPVTASTPAPQPVVVPPWTPQEQAVALLNTVAADVQQAITIIQGGK